MGPDNETASITFSKLTLLDDAILDFDLYSTSSHDQLTLGSELELNGKLNLNFHGRRFLPGQLIPIISGTGFSGSFTWVTHDGLAANLSPRLVQTPTSLAVLIEFEGSYPELIELYRGSLLREEALLDRDGDGFAAAFEFLAATDPDDPNSSPLMSTVFSPEGSFLSLELPDYLSLTESELGAQYSLDLKEWLQLTSPVDLPGSDDFKLTRQWNIPRKHNEADSLFLRLSLTLPPPNMIWGSTVIDDTNDSGRYASLAISPETNLPAISYLRQDPTNGFNQSLHFARLHGKTWNTEHVDGDLATTGRGAYCSLTYLNRNTPAISYLDGSPVNNLRFAFLQNGEWRSETVDDSGNVGRFTSLATHNRIIGIAYQRISSSDILFATRRGSNWGLEEVATTGRLGQGISLAFDPASGTHWISYENWDFPNPDSALQLSSRTQGTWSNGIVHSGPGLATGRESSLKFHPVTGLPAVSFAGDGLWFAEFDGTRWNVTSVAPNARYTSLAFHPETGEPYISFFDPIRNQLVLASRETGTWSRRKIDSGEGIGQFTSLAFDSNGTPHLAYYDETAGALKYATLVPDPRF